MLAAGKGCARFGWDDGYLLGPPDLVCTALENFSQNVLENCGLVLQRSKTEVYSRDGVLPAGTPEGLVRAGGMIAGQWEPGMICYGVPVGSDCYVEFMLDKKVTEVAQEVGTICEVLESERQALWTVLRSSISQRLDYWLALVYPSNVRAAAEKMDRLIMTVLEKLIGVHIPLESENLGWDCPLHVPIQGLESRSFQQWVIRQPVKSGGLGLRSHVELSPAAFIGAIEQALPHFIGEGGVCTQLSPVLGDGAGLESMRWQQLLQSGCRTGRELRMAWQTLQAEARQCTQYLGQELDGHLAA